MFACDGDRRRYLALLGEYGAAHGMAVYAYCLMTNHVHLVAVPETVRSLCGALKPVHLRYAQEFNRRKTGDVNQKTRKPEENRGR